MTEPPAAEPPATNTEPPPTDPPAARVRGNDWTTLAVDPPGEFTPRRSVTVVVPYYQAPEALALTLAALEGQTYPRDLFEVVVVDDGSNPPLAPVSDSPLAVRVVHQPDRGFGLARARNTGARVAAGEILVFLDCDMMPEADWLASHARWHHAASDVLSIGFRAHVSEVDLDPAAVRSRAGSLADLFEGRPVERPEWIDFHMARTADLTAWSEDLFRVVTGGNFGISRRFYEQVGGFDESFTQWGAEDIEFGFRAFTRAGVLVPERSAFCWHQGPGATPSPAEQSSLDLQRAKIAHLIAHSGFRRDRAGRSFTVPQYVVSVGPGPLEMVFTTIEQVLASGIHDLVVWVEQDGAGQPGSAAGALSGDEREWLSRQFGPDPRVWFGPAGGALDCFPYASFHIAIPAAATVKYPLIRRMRWSLSSADLAVARLHNGAEVSIARTRVLHRALRSGLDIADVGHVRRMSPAGLGLESGPRSVLVHLLTRRYARFLPGGLKFRALGSKPVGHPVDRSEVDNSEIRRMAKLTRMLSRIRTYEDLRLFVLWIGFALKWRIDRRRNAIPDSLAAPPRPAGPAAAASSSSAEIPTVPLGADRPSAPAFDLAADLITFDRLSVPVFDLTAVNPIGWTPDFDDTVVSLGPPEWIQPGAVVGATVTRCWPVYGPADLRRARCVVDVAAYHDGPLQRAAVLAELAAAGAVVHLADAALPDAPASSSAPASSNGPDLRECLGSELHDLMSRADALSADARQRELISIRLRRAALRSHSISARPPTPTPTASPGAAVGARPSWPPEVSVLLPTRRPDLLTAALANVARQTYPRLELVLAAHGDGFDPARGLRADRPARLPGPSGAGQRRGPPGPGAGRRRRRRLRHAAHQVRRRRPLRCRACVGSGAGPRILPGRDGGQGGRVRLSGRFRLHHPPLRRQGRAVLPPPHHRRRGHGGGRFRLHHPPLARQGQAVLPPPRRRRRHLDDGRLRPGRRRGLAPAARPRRRGPDQRRRPDRGPDLPDPRRRLRPRPPRGRPHLARPTTTTSWPRPTWPAPASARPWPTSMPETANPGPAARPRQLVGRRLLPCRGRLVIVAPMRWPRVLGGRAYRWFTHCHEGVLVLGYHVRPEANLGKGGAHAPARGAPAPGSQEKGGPHARTEEEAFASGSAGRVRHGGFRPRRWSPIGGGGGGQARGHRQVLGLRRAGHGRRRVHRCGHRQHP